ncbi:MAG: extradiol dioxygenase [Treponema sp.]|nr:MAG: extradiol dioxygenase [Treponema sp.]
MKFNSVVIRTKEMQKSIDFYEKVLGFEFDYMMSASLGKQIAFLKDKKTGMNLELIFNDKAVHLNETRMSLTMAVDQISEAEKYLKEHNVKIVSPPRTVKDGKKILTAVDPSGVEIDFIEF